MNINRIYIYAPQSGGFPANLEQALVQGEQLRQSLGGQAVPEALLTLAGQLEAYAASWAEGVNEEEEEDEEDELQEPATVVSSPGSSTVLRCPRGSRVTRE